jgi:hypothetical protein
MKPLQLKSVIAERALLAHKGKHSKQVIIQLDRPAKSSHSPDYKCHHRIIGVGDEKIRSASGEDSMQALQLALNMIGIELFVKHKGYRFTWLGSDEIGFPRPTL